MRIRRLWFPIQRRYSRHNDNMMKLRGGTLFLVLIIAMVIAVISSSMVMLSYLNRTQVFNNNLYVHLKNNAESGVAILLANQDSSFAADGLYVDLYGSGSDTVYIKKQSWGLFAYVLASASAKGSTVKRHYLVGQRLSQEVDCALYLCDQGRPLSLCGDTRITGHLYLPQAGIRREYAPEPYTGMELFSGKEHKSNSLLPKIDRGIVNVVEKYSTLSSQNIPEASSDTLYNSFENATIVVNLGRRSRLPYKVVKGNVLIVCDSVLQLSQDLQLEDAICVARGLTFEEGFKGIGQFFAFDSIIVNSQTKLMYPSVLGLIKKDFRYQKPFIKVAGGAHVKGMVFSLHEAQDLAGTLIQYQKNSFLEGVTYAEGYTEVNGKIYGSVLTYKFVLNTNSSIYENYLMNATIDQNKRSEQYLSGMFWLQKSSKRIAKCLY